MSIVLPFAEKFAVEEVSGDMLFPRSFATTAFIDNHIAGLSAMYEHISAICLPVTVVHYLRMSCEIEFFSDRSVQSAQKSFLQALRLIRQMFATSHLILQYDYR
jgi:hypothetical protein